jgi:hypothetical protein
VRGGLPAGPCLPRPPPAATYRGQGRRRARPGAPGGPCALAQKTQGSPRRCGAWAERLPERRGGPARVLDPALRTLG